MARLIVKNIGPIKNVDIELKKVNVFMGPQSCGKSTLAKIISFCSWMEKRKFAEDKEFAPDFCAYKLMQTYHKLSDAYFSESSKIVYVGENLVYGYNCLQDEIRQYYTGDFLPFDNWSSDKDRVLLSDKKLINPKVIYIPAERNFVSRVPNLYRYSEDRDNLQDFVSNWFDAKRHYTQKEQMDVLNLGVSYFSSNQDVDRLTLESGAPLDLISASSGLQSLVPLLVLIDWLAFGIYKNSRPYSPKEEQGLRFILQTLKDGDASIDQKHLKELSQRLMDIVKGRAYTHTQFILEEPEQNLFPDTQCELLYYLLSAINHGKPHRMVITTHSPYILYALNNCLLANVVKNEIPDEMKRDITPSKLFIDAQDVAVWEIEDGQMKHYVEESPNSTIQDKDGLIRRNYFDNVMKKVMRDFNSLLMFKE